MKQPTSQAIKLPQTIALPLPLALPVPLPLPHTKRADMKPSPSPKMNILVAPSGFKESLDPSEVADCIERGIRRVLPGAAVRKAPLADGGEGFARALVAATRGTLHHLSVTGPVGAPVASHFGVLGPGLYAKDNDGNSKKEERTAVVEMAAAAGLALVPPRARDPTATTTYGVGELMRAALDTRGVSRIVVGCGDSGTSDGGAGMLQALGARLLGRDGGELPRASGGAALAGLADVDLSGMHPRLSGEDRVEVECACNWRNVLCGPHGVARVYGPQKGATAPQVEELAAALDNYAGVVARAVGVDVAGVPGGGASGGLGAGLLVLGARLRPRYEAVMEYFGIGDLFGEEEEGGCQLVITAEGGIDTQTPRGKIPAEVAVRAKAFGIPVIALAGTVGKDADVNYMAGIDAFTSILRAPITLDEAIGQAEDLLVDAAESAMRMVLVGLAMRV